MLGAILITAISYGLYLGLYTAYDKRTKKIKFQTNLIDVMSFKNGSNVFMVENNKVMALNSLTTFGLAFVPYWREEMSGLLYCTLAQVMIHVV